jgi:carbamoyl-phosphate synthase large subunit
MKEPVRMLVTAVGSELACSVLKAARLSPESFFFVGCDMRERAVGRHWCDAFEKLPPASQGDLYLTVLKTLIQRHRISVVIPTADAELPLLAANKSRIQEQLSCTVLVNPLEELERFTDKYLAALWFQEHKIPSPKTALADDLQDLRPIAEQWGYPLILKPRIGGGSRYMFKVGAWDELKRHHPVVPRPLLQEHLEPDDEEYTAGTYRSMKGEIRVIVFKRTLKFGMTNTAETILDRPDLEDFCRDVISRTNLIGSNNIQFRDTATGPKVLEINPRFSGTTGIRAYCGFNDLEMWVLEAVGRTLPPLNPAAIKKRVVLRYMDELYWHE